MIPGEDVAAVLVHGVVKASTTVAPRTLTYAWAKEEVSWVTLPTDYERVA
jgi:hypothetical protein